MIVYLVIWLQVANIERYNDAMTACINRTKELSYRCWKSQVFWFDCKTEYGEGNVFKAELDQKTGRILWTKPIECKICE